jgi:hypothetical protein
MSKIYCNECGGLTNHLCKGEHIKKYEEFDPSIDGPPVWWEETTYRLMICAGCESGTLEEEWNNDQLSSCHERPEIKHIPQRTELDVSAKKFRRLSPKLYQIYKEAVGSFNAKLHVLCAAGLRALIEGICDDRGVTKGTLNKRIDGLKEFLPENIVTNLHAFRFMGNKAVHELTAPNDSELKLAIEISEDLLNYLYELDYKTRLLALAHESST